MSGAIPFPAESGGFCSALTDYGRADSAEYSAWRVLSRAVLVVLAPEPDCNGFSCRPSVMTALAILASTRAFASAAFLNRTSASPVAMAALAAAWAAVADFKCRRDSSRTCGSITPRSTSRFNRVTSGSQALDLGLASGQIGLRLGQVCLGALDVGLGHVDHFAR